VTVANAELDLLLALLAEQAYLLLALCLRLCIVFIGVVVQRFLHLGIRCKLLIGEQGIGLTLFESIHLANLDLLIHLLSQAIGKTLPLICGVEVYALALLLLALVNVLAFIRCLFELIQLIVSKQ